MNIWTFGVILIAYFALHSLLAATTVKKVLYKLIPQRFYRMGYNVTAIGLLLGLLSYFKKLPANDLFKAQPILGGLFLVLGSLLLILALRQYNLAEFAGTYQIEHKGKLPTSNLNQTGANRWVRHPLYSAMFLLLFGFLLVAPTQKAAMLVGISSLYLIIGTRLEEQKLVAEFGTAYKKYQQSVGRFFPRISRI